MCSGDNVTVQNVLVDEIKVQYTIDGFGLTILNMDVAPASGHSAVITVVTDQHGEQLCFFVLLGHATTNASAMKNHPVTLRSESCNAVLVSVLLPCAHVE